jgi:hypothetical protein
LNIITHKNWVKIARKEIRVFAGNIVRSLRHYGSHQRRLQSD